MTAYVRREKARVCPVHQVILSRAMEELEEYGYFAKSDVIEACGMEAVSEAIRWDYILEFLKDDGKLELVPLAEGFWHMTPEQRKHRPEQALAIGHAKKAVGYGLVELDGGALAVRQLEFRRSCANGHVKSTESYFREIVKHIQLEHKKTPQITSGEVIEAK